MLGGLAGWLGWLAGRLAAWLPAWAAACLAGWLAGWLAGCLAGWLAGCLGGCLPDWLAACLAGCRAVCRALAASLAERRSPLAATHFDGRLSIGTWAHGLIALFSLATSTRQTRGGPAYLQGRRYIDKVPEGWREGGRQRERERESERARSCSRAHF